MAKKIKKAASPEADLLAIPASFRRPLTKGKSLFEVLTQVAARTEKVTFEMPKPRAPIATPEERAALKELGWKDYQINKFTAQDIFYIIKERFKPATDTLSSEDRSVIQGKGTTMAAKKAASKKSNLPRVTITSRMKELIMKNETTEKILAVVRGEFPKNKIGDHYVSYYRNVLAKEGKTLPSNHVGGKTKKTKVAKAKKPAAAKTKKPGAAKAKKANSHTAAMATA